MINTTDFIQNFHSLIPTDSPHRPWDIVQNLTAIILDRIKTLSSEYTIENNVAIHQTAVIERNVIIKAPAIIGAGCFIGSNAYLRNGVFLSRNVTIGTGCEIKSSCIFEHSSIAHFNFIGDSLIGEYVNFEAGSITANHYNERTDKRIFVCHQGQHIDTQVEKFGALVGDHSKIGANAVLSPGTVLEKSSIVKRLELVEQNQEAIEL